MPTPEELGLPWEVTGKAIRVVNRETEYEVDGKMWKLGPNGGAGDSVCNCLGAGYGSSKKDPYNLLAVERAKFIVEACNNYHALQAEIMDLKCKITTLKYTNEQLAKEVEWFELEKREQLRKGI